MPTYEYRCRDCGHSFDIVQKMSDASLTHCPECGGELRKVFAPPAISFKGSGFYATDQRSKGKQATGSDRADKDKGDKDKGDKKDGSSETKKPDTKKTEGSSSSEGSSSDASSSATKKEGSS